MSTDEPVARPAERLLALLRIDPRSSIPLASQLAQQLVWLIASGQVQPKERLPSVRPLADHLGVAIHTVQSAYGQLQAAGLAETRHGSGTIVLPPSRRNLAAATPNLTSGTIAVLIPEFSPFYAPFLRGLQEGAREISSLLFVCDTEEFSPATTSSLDQLVAKGVDGLVVTSFGQTDSPQWRAALSSPAGLPPIVFADSPGMAGPGVVLDLEKGAFEAASHIAGHGHTRIGVVVPPPAWTNVEPILRGYRRGLAAHRLGLDETLISAGVDFSPESGDRSTDRLMDLPDPPTALLIASDSLAIGAIRALRRRGLSIPGDVALIGFDDIEVASVLDPSLTTVALPAQEMGRQAMAMLRRLSDGKRVRPQVVVIDSHLVVRRSCGCEPAPAA